MGEYHNAVTAGHNNRKWLKGLGKREFITISVDISPAKAGSHGMEAIGMNYAKSVNISASRMPGVGDDIIGTRFRDDVKIAGDGLSGVDGRTVISNSANVLVESGNIAREASPKDGKKKGSSADIRWL